MNQTDADLDSRPESPSPRLGISRLIAQTEARRNGMLREVDRHRYVLAQRLREAAQKIEDAEFTEVERQEAAE